MLFRRTRKTIYSDKDTSLKASRNKGFHDDETVGECPLLSLKPQKKKYEIAIFACGCFWNPQRRFRAMNGVKRVVVGYTGGQRISPSHKSIKDHTRALFVEYNPKKVSYLQLLAMWLDNDCPWEEPEEEEDEESSWANRSALFVTQYDQQVQAIDFLRSLAMTRPNCPLYVNVELATSFYQAEEYQQNYLDKQVIAARQQLRLFVSNQAPSGLYVITE